MSQLLATQTNNVWASKHFAIAMGGLMVFFIILHWVHVLWVKYSRKSSFQNGVARKVPLKHLRAIRRFLGTSILNEKISHWMVYFVYWIVNIVLILTNVDLSSHRFVGKRLGWICVSNLALLVFLALRNTPLAVLSGRSYEKLRPLHKTAGYTCILSAICHATVYLTAWAEIGYLDEMRLTANTAGGIAGLSMVIIGISTFPWIRKKFYEAFYLIHIILFILILITVGLHRPDITRSTLAIIISIACMWVSDRIIRFLRLCWYFPGNRATLTALPNNAIRVTLARSIRSTPGSHAYLWIPGIRWAETHPFTIVSQDPVQFVVRVHDGFTQDLFAKVAKSSQTTTTTAVAWTQLRCSLDGGYGQVADFMQFDRLLFIAGGSGASFTFAVALDIVKKCQSLNMTKMIDFIWVVRTTSSLEWFEQELSELRKNPNVRIFLYVTQTVENLVVSPDLVEKDSATPTNLSTDLSRDPVVPMGEVEKGHLSPVAVTSPETEFANSILTGRPSIEDHVTTCVESCKPTDRIGVGACGPVELVASTRKAVAQRIYDNGPSMTLYTEEFGW